MKTLPKISRIKPQGKRGFKILENFDCFGHHHPDERNNREWITFMCRKGNLKSDGTHQTKISTRKKESLEPKKLIVDGHAINNDDSHWKVNCPSCDRELEYIGYFDSGEMNKCECGAEFTTKRIYLNDGYIE